MASITLTGADLTLLGYTLEVRTTDLGLTVNLRNSAGDPVNAAELMLHEEEPRELVDEFETFALAKM